MRCSLRLASLALLLAGLTFFAVGCKQETSSESGAGNMEVAVEVSGMG